MYDSVRSKIYKDAHKQEQKEYSRKHSHGIRLRFLEMYGMSCKCCGETILEFLTIDHLAPETKNGETGRGAYLTALKEYRPDLYQVMCYNCNCARRHGICPHKLIK
jgi:hypothetical protein